MLANLEERPGEASYVSPQFNIDGELVNTETVLASLKSEGHNIESAGEVNKYRLVQPAAEVPATTAAPAVTGITIPAPADAAPYLKGKIKASGLTKAQERYLADELRKWAERMGDSPWLKVSIQIPGDGYATFTQWKQADTVYNTLMGERLPNAIFFEKKAGKLPGGAFPAETIQGRASAQSFPHDDARYALSSQADITAANSLELYGEGAAQHIQDQISWLESLPEANAQRQAIPAWREALRKIQSGEIGPQTVIEQTKKPYTGSPFALGADVAREAGA